MTIDLKFLPGIKLRDDEPVFAEPWEAQAFALAVSLHAQGKFTWKEWAAFLSAEVHRGEAKPYYQHWLDALEKLVAAKNLSSAEELAAREKEWHEAAARTPHGEPIEL